MAENRRFGWKRAPRIERKPMIRRSVPPPGLAWALHKMLRDPQVILFSENVPRAVAFYSRMGFVETFRVPTEGDPIHVDLVLDGYKIGIASVASTRADHGLDPIGKGQRAAVVVWTDDTSAAFSHMTANGALALTDPHEWLGRLLIAWVADPDGNPIQIAQHL